MLATLKGWVLNYMQKLVDCERSLLFVVLGFWSSMQSGQIFKIQNFSNIMDFALKLW